MDANPRQITRKNEEVDDFTCLSDDLLLEILKNMPPDQLRFSVKITTRRLYNLINRFILLDDASLIVEKPSKSYKVRLIDITEDASGLKTKEEFRNVSFHAGCIKSWVNDYVLLTDQFKTGTLYMFNLITKKGSLLPPCTTSCGGHDGLKCGVGLAFDKFKKVYKIIHVFVGRIVHCEILNFKSNNDLSEWKMVNGPDCNGQQEYYWEDPVSVEGRYLHWGVWFPEYLISMDTVTERFRQTRLPGSDAICKGIGYCMVEMGGCLALLHKISVDQVNIWMLKDYRRAKWEKFFSTSRSSIVCLPIYPGSGSDVLFPVTSVRSKRYMIFRKRGPQTGLYSFDLKNKIMKRLEIDIASDERCVVHSTTASSW